MSEKKELFIGYEYRDVTIAKDFSTLIIDGYENFGWQMISASTPSQAINSITVKFKRNRAIQHKAELTKLQRNFDVTLEEIQKLEKQKTFLASIVGFTIGLIGTCFMAGAVFAIDANLTILMVVLAIPGLIGWILPYFIFNKLKLVKTKSFNLIIEKKYDEIYEISKQGNCLL
ncbi:MULTISPECIES: hypothetical protein [unclassified Enterococcus]|uniref:hypothetical protein n=1 Tax=unclassified Enterococcus TaxID=2608891 RepID=UPI0015539EA7|nr:MULTISPECIES: hypothetical protein [unclassified Enterococcus]MBS7578189.1 hypothetical protein [Enterococcus sp. MMGLQ5-2]MBS7585435.1 hypothetical protein [Enterococcus sp. MMGLQ5-1]NPD13292.1 hypothetical protein [Enterococcus sp. MMGLQ5-1]NPD38020.1 hypothetical protein [Enterococcus sp. MMGLQ5-2]